MRRLMLVLAALIVLVAPARPPVRASLPTVTAAQPTLTDLQGVDDLRALFDRDAGTVRLVLLVSPT
ncbi:MAG: hypothetical protein ACRD1V_09935 [Vicinamibacterales bacterium]